MFKICQKLASYEYTYGGYTDVELHTECNHNIQTLNNTNIELRNEIQSLNAEIKFLKNNNNHTQISNVIFKIYPKPYRIMKLPIFKYQKFKWKKIKFNKI